MSRKIHRVDPETAAVLRTTESDRFVTDVTWLDGELWHGAWQDERTDVRRMNPETGEVFERLEMPAGTGASGFESDGGGRLFRGGGSSGKLRAESHPPTEKRRCGLLNDRLDERARNRPSLARRRGDSDGQMEFSTTATTAVDPLPPFTVARKSRSPLHGVEAENRKLLSNGRR